MRAAARRTALLAMLAVCAMPAIALSQEWRASARFGRVARAREALREALDPDYGDVTSVGSQSS